MLDDGEAEAGAADLAAAAGIDPVEALGQPRHVLGGDSFALVDHAEAEEVRPAVFEADPHRRLLAAIFERVDDEVGEHLAELAAVAGDQGLAGAVLDPDAAPGPARRQGGGGKEGR